MVAHQHLGKKVGGILGRHPDAAAGDFFGHDRVAHEQAGHQVGGRAPTQ
jgi:hypothetical protein